MKSRNGNFFTAHYEWLAVGGAVLALVAAIVYFAGEFGVEPDAAAAEAVQRLDVRNRDGKGVTPVELREYNLAAEFVRSPGKALVKEIKGTEASFLAAEKRVACRFCLEPIPFGAKTCWDCKKVQPEEKVVVLDSDGDGMPDEWEKRYGLNPDDAGDAHLDKDGDTGFVAKKYEHRVKKQKISGGGAGMEKSVDVSVVQLVRQSDKKEILLQKDEQRKPVDIQAKLVFTRNTRVEEFTVVPGDTISLYGEKYVVRAIRGKGKGAAVTLEQTEGGKTRTLEALEP